MSTIDRSSLGEENQPILLSGDKSSDSNLQLRKTSCFGSTSSLSLSGCVCFYTIKTADEQKAVPSPRITVFPPTIKDVVRDRRRSATALVSYCNANYYVITINKHL